MSSAKLVFLDYVEFDGGIIRGAALVTNEATEPVEFRCTSQIKPTTLQRILWGKRLRQYIAARLIGKAIWRSLSCKGDIVIVKNPDFLELRELIDVPLVQVVPEEEGRNTVYPLSARDKRTLQDGGSSKVLLMFVHQDYVEDLDTAEDLLAEIAGLHSVYEPFQRLKDAIQLLQQQTCE